MGQLSSPELESHCPSPASHLSYQDPESSAYPTLLALRLNALLERSPSQELARAECPNPLSRLDPTPNQLFPLRHTCRSPKRLQNRCLRPLCLGAMLRRPLCLEAMLAG